MVIIELIWIKKKAFLSTKFSTFHIRDRIMLKKPLKNIFWLSSLSHTNYLGRVSFQEMAASDLKAQKLQREYFLPLKVST